MSADFIDASTLVEAPIGDKTRFTIAVRKSYLDRTLSLVTSKDIGDIFPVPDYADGQIKLMRDLGQNESLEVFALGSTDSITRTVTSSDPTQVKSETTGFRFGRIMMRYRKQLDDGSSVSVTPSFGLDRTSTALQFGPTPTALTADGTEVALRTTWRGRLAKTVTAQAGLDIEATLSDLTRNGSVTSPPREGDIHAFGQAPPDRLNADAWSTAIIGVAPYGFVDIALASDRLHITPGLRVEPYVVAGSRRTPVVGDTPSIGFSREDTAVEPRLSARFDAAKWLSLKAAWGIYHQAPQASDLSAVFGNPDLGQSSAQHALAGATFKIGDTLSVETVGFVSLSDGLTSRSASPTPLLAQALVDDGKGRAYGGQILVRKTLAKGFFGWASYSLIRSERRDHPDKPYRLFDQDQTHVATVVASYQPGYGVEIGARVRFASGFPRTPVTGSFFDTRRGLYEPYFGAQNSTRLPAFFQADVRIAKKFTFGRASTEIYLDVQNVANTQNAEEIAYRYDYKSNAYITGLPILPVLGARLDY